MRILHLGDLHFGKLLYGISMVESGDQRFWVDQMLSSVKEEKPDVVVIAGDVYDRGVPPKEAVALLDYCLTELVKLVKKVLVISGNHDSGERLSFASGMLQKQGLYIAGKVDAKMECVTLEDEAGPVHFWLMPYVFPAAIKVAMIEEANREGTNLEEEDTNLNCFTSYDSAVRAYLSNQDINFLERNVMVAHQLVTNNGEEPEKGGSETLVGGVGQIEYTAFDGFDYVALGHIHGAQSVGKKNIRYAGAPLCYHFDEIKQKKGLLYIDLPEKGKEISYETKELPVLHRMRQIENTFENIMMTELISEAKQEYIRVVLKDETLPLDARAKLKTLFEGKGSILMDISREVSNKSFLDNKSESYFQKEKSVEEHFLDFYRTRTEGEEPDEKEKALIQFATEKTMLYATLGEDRNSSLEKDAMELVEFCLKQENEI